MSVILLQVFIVLSLLLFCTRWVVPMMLKLQEEPLLASYQPKVSIIMSCFNEGEDVYHTLMSLAQVDYPKDLLEIIAIDDCSTDNSFTWMEKAAAAHPWIKVVKNETNRGKHRNMLAGVEMSTGEMIICTDSDLVYEPDVVKQLVGSFRNEKIGAVGGVVGIKNPDVNAVTRWQTMIYHYGFNLWKMPESSLGTVFCISGCLFCIKRTLFDQIKGEIDKRNWFGLEIKGGEDRFMTHQVLLAGYDTIVNTNAKCYTTAPPTIKQLFMQQLRWKRSGLMMFFWALRRPGVHVKRFTSASLALLLMPPMLSLSVLIAYIGALISGDLGLALVDKFLFSIMVLSCIAFISTMILNITDDRQRFARVLFLPAFAFWYIVIDQLFLPFLALLTLDEKGWSSR